MIQRSFSLLSTCRAAQSLLSTDLCLSACYCYRLIGIGPLQAELGESDPCVFVIEYCDGFRAFLLGMGSYKVPRNVDDGQICEATHQYLCQ